MKRDVGLVLVVMLSLGCGPVIKYSPINSASRQQQAPDKRVRVFLTASPECPYEELGIVRASNGAFAGGMDTFIDAMKEKAKEVGGDAIILGGVEARTSGYVQVAPGIVAAAEGQSQTGVVIQFTQPGCVD